MLPVGWQRLIYKDIPGKELYIVEIFSGEIVSFLKMARSLK